MKQYNWEQDQIAHMKVNTCRSNLFSYINTKHMIGIFLELHSTFWSWKRKTCKTSSKQGENISKNGCTRFN